MRQLRNWHDRTGLGDETDPLLAPDSDTLLLHVTRESYAAFEAFLATQQAAENTDAEPGGKAA